MYIPQLTNIQKQVWPDMLLPVRPMARLLDAPWVLLVSGPPPLQAGYRGQGQEAPREGAAWPHLITPVSPEGLCPRLLQARGRLILTVWAAKTQACLPWGALFLRPGHAALSPPDCWMVNGTQAGTREGGVGRAGSACSTEGGLSVPRVHYSLSTTIS